jgi:hypothetical protein
MDLLIALVERVRSLFSMTTKSGRLEGADAQGRQRGWAERGHPGRDVDRRGMDREASALAAMKPAAKP